MEPTSENTGTNSVEALFHVRGENVCEINPVLLNAGADVNLIESHVAYIWCSDYMIMCLCHHE